MGSLRQRATAWFSILGGLVPRTVLLTSLIWPVAALARRTVPLTSP